MKYQSEITIDRPLEKVVELFDNPENMKVWQPGLVSFETIEGEPGKEGAISKLQYKMGKREIEMKETILRRNLPHEFSGTYEAKGVYNIMENYFDKVDDNTTRWRADVEFQFDGFAMKVMAWLMPRAFRKQTIKNMQNFKEFAESEAAK